MQKYTISLINTLNIVSDNRTERSRGQKELERYSLILADKSTSVQSNVIIDILWTSQIQYPDLEKFDYLGQPTRDEINEGCLSIIARQILLFILLV